MLHLGSLESAAPLNVWTSTSFSPLFGPGRRLVFLFHNDFDRHDQVLVLSASQMMTSTPTSSFSSDEYHFDVHWLNVNRNKYILIYY